MANCRRRLVQTWPKIFKRNGPGHRVPQEAKQHIRALARRERKGVRAAQTRLIPRTKLWNAGGVFVSGYPPAQEKERWFSFFGLLLKPTQKSAVLELMESLKVL